jgi:hypothetical protein
MAEYIKLGGTAAKVVVAMVLGALLTGAVENAQGGAAKVTVRPAAATHELQAHAAHGLKGGPALNLKGLSPELRGNFRKIGTTLATLSKDAGIFYYFQHQGATHKFETIDEANARFLSISAANAKYLRSGETAQNSNELGGLPPNAFVQGDGTLVSGAATLSRGAQQKLMSIPGIEVDVATNVDGLPSVTINNGTGVSLPAVQDQGGTDGGITLQPGANSLTLSLQNGVDQLHLQTFAAGSFNHVLTMTISINFNAALGSSSFAGELIDGGT